MPEIPDPPIKIFEDVRLSLGTDYLSRPVQRAIEITWESAYRAGREDAARDLEAEADDEAQRPGRAEPSELIERWLREAARIAREGSSLKRSSEGEDQDTPEGRT